MGVYLLDLRSVDIPAPTFSEDPLYIESATWYGARQVAARLLPLEDYIALGRALKVQETTPLAGIVYYEGENRTELLQKRLDRAVPAVHLNGSNSASRRRKKRSR